MYNNVRNKKLTDNPLLSFTFECRITINYLRYVDIIGYIFALNRKIFLYFLKLFSIYFNALIMLFFNYYQYALIGEYYMSNNIKVLVISDFKVIFENNNLVKFNYLRKPTRFSLEEVLRRDTYDCIIPLTHRFFDESSANCNILYTLEKKNYVFFGNSYIKNIMINEKPASLCLSNMQNDFILVTKSTYYNEITQIINEDFPICVDIMYNKDNIIVNSTEELNHVLDNIFSVQNNEEVIIWKNYSFESFVEITIIGKSPYSIEIVTGDESMGAELISKAYELFNLYAFKDFAAFKFGRKNNRFYLLNINCGDIFSSKLIDSVQRIYNIKPSKLVFIYILVCLVRLKNKNAYVNKHIKALSTLIPTEIFNSLLPLNDKIEVNESYNYKDICYELKNRLMSDNDNNRTDTIRLIKNAMMTLPHVNEDSYYLGDQKFDYTSFLADFENLPDHPKEQQIILNNSLKILNGQIRWNSALTLYNVCSPTMMNTVAASMITNLYNPNGMLTRTSAGYLYMEKQIVRQLSRLVGIDPDNSAGVFASGGKVCLAYAVKCGLNRCQRVFGYDTEPVVITSDSNHFSIEAVAFQLGIQPSQCIRIPVTEKETINLNDFSKVIDKCFCLNIPIASIIVSGGNTTYSAVENLQEIEKILAELIKKYSVEYKPYIYYDMVVCWIWLFFKKYNFTENKLGIPEIVLTEIKHISDIFQYSSLADGFGFDFHKCAFSPYTTGLFLTKQSSELYSLSKLNEENNEIESCYYTFGNSRSVTNIISAWNILQSMGTEGFQSYIANTLESAHIFRNMLSKYGFEIIGNKITYGFGTLIWAKSPKLAGTFEEVLNSTEATELNNDYLYGLSEYLKKNPIANLCVRYLPKHRYAGKSITVLSLLPITLNINAEKAKDISVIINSIKNDFDEKYISDFNMDFEQAPIDVPR